MNFSENGISYKYLKTDRFKTTLLSVTFYTPLNGNAAANSLCCALMSKSSKEYPNYYSLNRKLASLYGAHISSWTEKCGDRQEIHFGITAIDSKYSINGEDVVSEAGKLLLDMIFGKYLDGSEFSSNDIAREKRLLIETINGKLNDKRLFARKRAEEIMCSDEPFGLSTLGTIEEVEVLAESDVKAALNRFIKESFISIVVVGADEPTCFISDFERLISSVGRHYMPINEEIVKPAGELKEVIENMPVKQGKLVLGLRSTDSSNLPESAKAFVMTDIFGGGPHSRLFSNVREKLSLCYYCSARGIRSKGLIFIESGVEKEKVEDAKIAILKEFNTVKNGEFTDTELHFSKLSLADSFRSVESDQQGLARWYDVRALSGKDISPEAASKAVEAVTRDDVIKAAKNYALDTIYLLNPDGSVKEDEE